MGEFELIDDFFARRQRGRSDVELGIGDDAALIRLPPNNLLVVSTDTLVAGTHFFEDADPQRLGHKALAVNLSDLAAMGAVPCWLSLALTLPRVDEAWLEAFSEGFLALADYYDCQLIGGDTTRGPLSITVSVKGIVPDGHALRRDGARPGDLIYVTGELGGAALALAALQGHIELDQVLLPPLLERLELPQPRVLAGCALRGLASSLIDLSDGLASDLMHILRRSGCAAQVELRQLPLPAALLNQDESQRYTLALAGGDDYELCFTIPESHRGSMETALAHAGVSFTCIGRCVSGTPAIKWLADGCLVPLALSGWDHFGEKHAR